MLLFWLELPNETFATTSCCSAVELIEDPPNSANCLFCAEALMIHRRKEQKTYTVFEHKQDVVMSQKAFILRTVCLPATSV